MKIVVIILALVAIDIILDTIVLGPARVKSILSSRFRRKTSHETVQDREEDPDFYCNEDDF